MCAEVQSVVHLLFVESLPRLEHTSHRKPLQVVLEYRFLRWYLGTMKQSTFSRELEAMMECCSVSKRF